MHWVVRELAAVGCQRSGSVIHQPLSVNRRRSAHGWLTAHTRYSIAILPPDVGAPKAGLSEAIHSLQSMECTT